jgi:WD40 repeat protein
LEFKRLLLGSNFERSYRFDLVINIIIYGDKLISCSEDKTIKIWNLKNYSEGEVTLEGHTDRIRNMITYGDYLISCSGDKSIKIWNLKYYQLLYTFENINTFTLYLHRGLLYCNDDKDIKVLKFEPAYQDYQNATFTVFDIINKPKISFRGQYYTGKFYLRGLKRVSDMYDNYNNYVK